MASRSRAPSSSAQQRATPADALELARRKWLGGERLDMGQLARELGVGRATLFRWVGSREQLYAEVVSTIYARHRAQLLERARGTGLSLLDDVVRRNLRTLSSARPLRRFVEHDSQFAIRLLTAPDGRVQRRSIELEVDFLRRVVAEAKIRPQLDLETLAYIIIRIGEAFVYADTIAGSQPAIEKAVAAIHILVAAEKTRR